MRSENFSFLSLLCSDKDDPPTPPWQDRSHPAPSVTEMSNLIIFLLDVLPLVNNSHSCSQVVHLVVKNNFSDADPKHVLE